MHQPAISARVLKRQEELSKEIRDIAWKAQLRLCTRFNHLSAQHKQRNKIVTAIARELVGFMWAIARCVAQGSNQTKEAERRTTTPPDTIVLRRRPRPQSRQPSAQGSSVKHARTPRSGSPQPSLRRARGPGKGPRSWARRERNAALWITHAPTPTRTPRADHKVLNR